MLFMDVCDDLMPFINLVKNGILPIIQIGIPILLIIMGSLDLGKAVMASDDKEIKAATSKLIKRAIAAAAVFFVVFAVNLVMNILSDNSKNADDETVADTATFVNCWNPR